MHKMFTALFKQIYRNSIQFLRTKINRVQLIILIASFVGLTSGMIAVLLKTMVHYLQHWIQDLQPRLFLYLIFPVIGLLLTVFVLQFFFKGQIQKGIAMVLRAIARGSSIIPLSHTWSHVITSTLTVGLGGSVGLEAPIVATGSAVGSNISRITDLNYQERTLLIACGAAAGISAVFNAPIAGVIFAVEVLLTETIVSYFIPLIISSVIGVLCSKILLGDAVLFNFTLKQAFDYWNVPFYILLGVLLGFLSVYYAWVFKQTEHKLHHLKINDYTRAVIGGLFLAVIIFILPPLYGEGYNSIKVVANGTYGSFVDNTGMFSVLDNNWGIILFSLCIVLLKPVAAGITIGSGGNGGNFAPSLFTGAYFGFFFSRLINSFSWVKIPVGNFSLVAMAGMLSGVMYCPLTAIFLIAEITNGYELFIPLMIVSSTSFFIAKSKESYSMDIRQLAMEGQIFTDKKERNILTSIQLSEIMQDKYESIQSDKRLTDLVEIIKKSEKSIFAVHSGQGRFIGIIELNDIKHRLFQPEELRRVVIGSIMKKPAATLRHDEDMLSVMKKFDLTQSWYLPVLDADEKFVGFISKTKLFKKYREILASHGDLYDV
jgi:CIC family chloride channel protein